MEEKGAIGWPDVEAVWPDHRDYRQIECSGHSFSSSYTRLVRAMREDITLRLAYVKDVFGRKADWFTAYVYKGEPSGPVAFEDMDRAALVMPVFL
jgi:hypothetical protein